MELRFNLNRSYFDPDIGNNYQTLLLAVVVVMFLWLLAGGRAGTE
jgi:hypothetical protein